MRQFKKEVLPKDEFALLRYLPDSSPELHKKLKEILDQSESWSARVVYVNRESGEYRIMLSGTMNDFDIFPRN